MTSSSDSWEILSTSSQLRLSRASGQDASWNPSSGLSILEATPGQIEDKLDRLSRLVWEGLGISLEVLVERLCLPAEAATSGVR